MSARAIGRALAASALAVGTLGTPAAVARADDNLRLVYATFTGIGTVVPRDAGRTYGVGVDADTDECTAVVIVGAGVPTPVRCEFKLTATVTAPSGVYCAGETIAPGVLAVYPPDYAYPHAFTYSMRVVLDEASVHGFGSSGGAAELHYAQFAFVGTTCARTVPNYGIAEY